MNTHALHLPALVIEVNGQLLAPEMLAALAEVHVQQRLSRPTLGELTFLEAPPAAHAALQPGATLEVGLAGTSERIFQGEITATELAYSPTHARELRVRGYDRLHRLRKQQPVRAHVQVGIRELARELLAEVGLDLRAPELTCAPLWRHLIQHRQTNLDVLDEITGACGLFYTLRGEVLHLLTLEGEGEPIPLELGGSLLEARVEANADPACRSVAALAWDPLHGERHAGHADRPRVGRRVLAAVPPAQVGGAPERTLVSRAVPDDDHAQALAQAELDLRAAREVVFNGVAEGNPALCTGALIQVSGLDAAFNGTYVLTSVTHRIDSQHGFITEIGTCPPPARRQLTGASMALGIVTRVDDPEGLGRVQVSLPAYGGVQTDWMNVLMLGAGTDKGLMILPDVEDQVVVLCAQEDPAQGVVLGGIYGRSGPPERTVESTSVKRFILQTPGGQRVRLDDAKELVRIENQHGSFVELTPQHVKVHAHGNLHLAAPGHTVTIAGKAINFEEA